MKLKILILLLIFSAISFSQCKPGPDPFTGLFVACASVSGSIGPTGPTGPSGATGPTGPGGVTTTISFSATPTFTVSTSWDQNFVITLTGNVTSSTMATGSATSGQLIAYSICQDSTGSRTFVWPTNVVGPGTIDGTANACSSQLFRWDGSNAVALSSIVVTGAPPGSVLTLFGSSSGSTNVQPAAAASGTLTLPAATDTLIGKATTDTLTNKTYDTAGTGNSFSINGVAATANTGTGSIVRATSPTITGAALTSSTVNKITFTTPATGATLSIPDGVALTGPASSGTAATLGNNETFSGNKTFTGVLDASGASRSAPAKSGTSVPGTCTVGDVYFKTDATAGQNLYYCTSTNSFTQQLNSGGGGGGAAGASLFATTASTTVTQLTPTTLIGTVTGSTTVSANTFTAGQPLQIVAEGYYATPATPASLTIDLLIGGTIRITTGAVVQIASVTTGVWRLSCLLTTRATGVSGTQIANCIFEGTGSTLTAGEAPLRTTSTWTIDTTAGQAVDLQATWSTATGSPSITATNIVAWIPGAPVTSVTINNGSPSTGAVNITGVEVTANKDANSGYAGLDSSGLIKMAEFPVNTYYLGGVRLVNPTIITFYGPHIAGGGKTDIYTCPAAKRCAWLFLRLYNDGSTLTATETDGAMVKISSTYYWLQNPVASITTNTVATITLFGAEVGYIADAAQILAVNITTGSQINATGGIVTFDATTPLRSANAVLASGDNVLYQVSSPVLGAMPLTTAFQPMGIATTAAANPGLGTPSVICSNTNATPYTANAYQVSGSTTTASTNKIFNALSVSQNLVSNAGQLTTLANLDSVVVNASVGNSGEFCYFNLVEYK